jgi:hypothetical protein
MYGRGHEQGTRRQRQPRKATLAKHAAQAELFERWLAGKTVDQLLAMTPAQAKEDLQKITQAA